LNIYRVFSESPRAVVLAVTGFAASVTATSLIMAFIVIPSVIPGATPSAYLLYSIARAKAIPLGFTV
jgi:hypothetical protein